MGDRHRQTWGATMPTTTTCRTSAAAARRDDSHRDLLVTVERVAGRPVPRALKSALAATGTPRRGDAA
jgi:hypothetical protein